MESAEYSPDLQEEVVLSRDISLGEGVVPTGIKGIEKRPLAYLKIDKEDAVLQKVAARALEAKTSCIPYVQAYQINKAIGEMFEQNPNYASRIERQLERDGEAVTLGEIINSKEDITTGTGADEKGYYTFRRKEPEKYVGECRHVAAVCAAVMKAEFGNGSYVLLKDHGQPHSIAKVKVKGITFYADPTRGLIYPAPVLKQAYGVSQPDLEVKLE